MAKIVDLGLGEVGAETGAEIGGGARAGEDGGGARAVGADEARRVRLGEERIAGAERPHDVGHAVGREGAAGERRHRRPCRRDLAELAHAVDHQLGEAAVGGERTAEGGDERGDIRRRIDDDRAAAPERRRIVGQAR